MNDHFINVLITKMCIEHKLLYMVMSDCFIDNDRFIAFKT